MSEPNDAHQVAPPEAAPPEAAQPEAAALPSPRTTAKAERWAYGSSYAGVILWSYVVVGEYVVGARLPEVLGWSVFLGLLVGAFLHGANRVGLPAMRRMAAWCLGGVVSFVAFVSSLAGTSSRSEYQAISAFLLLAAIAAILFGALRQNRLRVAAGEPKKKTTWTEVTVWVIFGGNSLFIMVELLSQA